MTKLHEEEEEEEKEQQPTKDTRARVLWDMFKFAIETDGLMYNNEKQSNKCDALQARLEQLKYETLRGSESESEPLVNKY